MLMRIGMFVVYYLERIKNREEFILNKMYFYVKGYVIFGLFGYVVVILFLYIDFYWLIVFYDVMF